MPVDEYISSPLVSTANSFIAERYLKLRDVNVHDDDPIPNGLDPSLQPPPPPHHSHRQPLPIPDLQRNDGIQYQNHVQHMNHEDNSDESPNRHEPPLNQPYPLPQPLEENFGFAIVETPVPSYDGTHMNMCYNVDRIDLNQL